MIRLEYECRKCGMIVNAEQYELSHFCPNTNCGTILLPKPQPRHWLFQFNPSAYRWLDRIKETSEPEQWLASQCYKLINKNDLAAIWCSGQKSGIYALGKIITNPKKTPLNATQTQYFLDKSYALKFEQKPSVFLEYFKVFVDKPVLQDQCNQNAILSSMQVLSNPQRTNFRLSNEEWEQIEELSK